VAALREPADHACLVGVDVGGTFTDAAVIADGRLYTAKVPTTPDQSEGVIAAIELALKRAGVERHDVGRFAHGMTVGTNALLQERGARTALLATEGFTDVIEIGRQTRPDLYRLCAAKPAPLVPAELRFPVRERVTPTAVLTPLDEQQLASTIERLAEAEVESVAISLLHSYSDPTHERRVADAVAERLPGVHVSASHDVLAVFREYERTSTTVIDAYLSPLLRGYIERLADRVQQTGLPEPEIMQSSGGVMPAAAAARHGAWTVLSGPAGGAVGAAYVGDSNNQANVLSFDMGGTSCDVAVVDGGNVRQTPERVIEGRVLQLPMVDVHTVGAGGGSVAWVDAGGALRVGPGSAGAQPGPACYGLGGTEPTVTDANLLLGYLSGDSGLAGGVSLDREAAERAVNELAARVGMDAEEMAAGIVRVADQEMLGALRVVTVERGVDPRGYALVAFGGAGPMHAARLADQLGIKRVLCPGAAGVLSALGLIVSDRRRDFARSVLLSGQDLTAERIDAAAAALIEAARRELPGSTVEISYDLRYRGQAFELTIAPGEQADPARMRELFERVHEERYGYSDLDGVLELVNIRVAARLAGAKPDLHGAGETARPRDRTTRQAIFGGERVETDVVHGELAHGEGVEGPAVCELPEATVVVPPAWHGEVTGDGTLVLGRR
jgi:N-methylhydantoinase A